MSRLRDRLERILGPTGAVEQAPSSEPDSACQELRRRLDRILGPGRVVAGSELAPPTPRGSPSPRSLSIEQLVSGDRVATATGSVFRAEWSLPASQRHGRVTVGEMEREIMGGARELFPEALREVDHPSRLAFLDTETTGLGTGAGTIPFLVGVGRWRAETGAFRVIQLFLEDLQDEAALLEVLARELDGAGCLVTYNGRNYDVPLLQNRHILQRVDWPLGRVKHLDLLYPARTLWSDQHPDCRLTTLERELLAFTRRGDIPGAEIPPLYREYLARGADERMAAVFHHNRDDIVSLAGLLGAAGRAARCPEGRSALGVGFLHSRQGRSSAARTALEAALCEELSPRARSRALKELSLAHKRAGSWQEALTAWREMRQLEPGDPFPIIETAKALEHGFKDLDRALRHVEDALRSGPWPPSDREDLERRRTRLLRKRGRGTGTHRLDPT